LAAGAIQVAGRTSHLGRPAFALGVVPAPASPATWSGDLASLGAGADEYRFLLDVERGVLLRSEARLEGRPFLVKQLTAVTFDAHLPATLFDLTPPAGASVVEPPRRLALAELAAAVPFPVWARSSVPSACVSAELYPADPVSGLLVQVSIDYPDALAGGLTCLLQSAEPLPETRGVPWRTDGDLRVAELPARDHTRCWLRFRIGPTHLQLESTTLSMAELVSEARSLRRL
jgi:hypothetical protein